MAYRVIFRPRATRNLNAIADYIAKDNRRRADTFATEVENACRNLGTFPLSGRARNDLEPGLRILSHRRQVTIVYRVERDRVLILNIFKAGQDYEAIIRRRGDKP